MPPNRQHKPRYLRGYRTFTKILDEGQFVHAGPLRGFYRLRAANGTGKITVGFTVTRAVTKAVRRNRVKRLLREAWRLQEEEIRQQAANLGQAADLIVLYTGTGGGKQPGFREIAEQLRSLLTKFFTRVARQT